MCRCLQSNERYGKKCRTASAEELEALEARSAELSIEMKKLEDKVIVMDVMGK